MTMHVRRGKRQTTKRKTNEKKTKCTLLAIRHREIAIDRGILIGQNLGII
jgi:hypothetical protein